MSVPSTLTFSDADFAVAGRLRSENVGRAMLRL
jgi:hypothetical protein